jgi:hypothetical protein
VSVSSPISPVLDHLADLALWEAELAADPAVVASALLRRLGQVPDRRGRRGLRHPLVVVLVLTACATLVVGNDSIAAIWQWAARTSQDVLERIGARRDPLRDRFTVPSERTFRRVLADLDADALDLATCRYAMDVVCGTAPTPVLAGTPGPTEREQRRAVARTAEDRAPGGQLPGAAVDGKALCGARTAAGRVFLVAAVAHGTGVILGQRQVPDKRGETTVVHDLLAPLDVAGTVLTLDALHTTKKTARLITNTLHAHYILILKGNQPLTLHAAQALLAGTERSGRPTGCRGPSITKSGREPTETVTTGTRDLARDADYSADRQVIRDRQPPHRGAVLGCIPPSRLTCTSTVFVQLSDRIRPPLRPRFGPPRTPPTCSPWTPPSRREPAAVQRSHRSGRDRRGWSARTG